MAAYDETEVYGMSPVASVSTAEVNNLEGEELRKYVFKTIQPVEILNDYKITERDIGAIISHHCGYRKKKKAALLSIPYVINANLVISPWRTRLGDDGQPVRGYDRRLSGMIGAPILIDGVKYLCNITLRKSRKTITPYSLTLKDENGDVVEEKMDSISSNVPHSSSEPTAIGDARLDKTTISHDTNPSSQGAKVQQNVEIDKNNQENKGFKTEQYMNKKLIRLTEQDLHRIVKESVNKVLNEIGDTERGQYALGAIQARADMRARNALTKGNRDEYQHYSNISGNADKTSFKHNYIGDMDANYDKRKDLYNAKQRGYKNYASYMNGAGNADYRTAPQTRKEVGY